MKKKYYSFILSTMLLININKPVFADEHHHHHHEEISGSKISNKSIYLLDSKWKDQNNKSLQLKDFAGKPVIISMLYTSCTKSCPIIMEYIKDFYNSLSKKEKENVRVLIISINPEKDTPKVLKTFEKKHKLDKNFFLLSGNKDTVLEIASLLGIRYVKTDEDYSHTNKILVLNKKGEIIHQNEGLTEDLKETKKYLDKAFM